MIRIFLADDNKLARDALIRAVSGKLPGYELAGQAENGTEALERILWLHPDILILDIKMPGMSGLEVLEKVREKELPCECIIVTGYDEFAYARQGIRLNVFDFLLKPVNDEELLNTLKRAGERLVRNGRAELSPAETGDALSDSFYGRLLLESVLGNTMGISQLEECLRREIRFTCCELMLISPEAGLSPGGADLFAERQQKILQKEGRIRGYRTIQVWVRNMLAVLILFQNVRFGRDYDLDALYAANEIFNENRADGVEVSVSISGQSGELGSLPRLFEQAAYAYNSRFFFENRHVLHYGTVKSGSIRNGFRLRGELDEFYRNLTEQPDRVTESIRKIGGLIEGNTSYDVEYIKNILIHMGLMLNGSVRGTDAEYNEAALWKIVQNVNESRNVSAAVAWLENYARQVISYKQQTENGRFSVMTVRILDYLRENYQKKLSLQDVSGYMGISVSNICRLLKTDTGETFVTLLNKIRIQEAIRMLRSGEYRVYEIAEIVGFGNYAYFYQLFKKETGCSPTKFEKEDYSRK